MTRFQYLGHLLFKPRDSSERFVQVLMWTIILGAGGCLVWENWQRYGVRGEHFNWAKDGKELASFGGLALMILGSMCVDSSKKWRVLGMFLNYVGLAIFVLSRFDWKLMAMFGVGLCCILFFQLLPKPKKADLLAAAATSKKSDAPDLAGEK